MNINDGWFEEGPKSCEVVMMYKPVLFQFGEQIQMKLYRCGADNATLHSGKWLCDEHMEVDIL